MSAALEKIGRAIEKAKLNAQVEVEVQDDGCWHLLARDGTVSVAEGRCERPDVILRCSAALLESVASGELDVLAATSSGELEVSGDLGILALLEGALSARD